MGVREKKRKRQKGKKISRKKREKVRGKEMKR